MEKLFQSSCSLSLQLSDILRSDRIGRFSDTQGLNFYRSLPAKDFCYESSPTSEAFSNIHVNIKTYPHSQYVEFTANRQNDYNSENYAFLSVVSAFCFSSFNFTICSVSLGQHHSQGCTTDQKQENVHFLS